MRPRVMGALAVGVALAAACNGNGPERPSAQPTTTSGATSTTGDDGFTPYPIGTSQPENCRSLPGAGPGDALGQVHDCWIYFVSETAYAYFYPWTLEDDRSQGYLSYAIPTAHGGPGAYSGKVKLPRPTGTATPYDVTDRFVCFTTPRGGFGAFDWRDEHLVEQRSDTDCPPEPDPPPDTTWVAEGEPA